MSIADELALLANTKENLRLSLGLSKDVPFSQYASILPFHAKAGTVFDFVNNQYSKDQLPVNLNDISEFIRLSSATMWHEEQLVEVADNVPRISGEGLLIEPQRTNILKHSSRPNLWRSAAVTFSNVGNETAFIKTGGYSYIAQEDKGASFIGKSITRTWVAKTLNGTGAALNFGATVSGGDYVSASGPNIFVSGHIKPNNTSNRMVYGEWIENSLYTVDSVSATGVIGLRLLDAADSSVTYIHLEAQVEEGTKTSIIRTGASPVTRSKETLVIPFLDGQAVTADMDAGVTMTISDNNAVFEGHGYIRNVRVN